MRFLTFFGILAAFVGGSAIAEAQVPVSYTLTDLGYLGSTRDETVPAAINDSGAVVGYSYNASASAYKFFLYSGGTMTSLYTCPSDFISEEIKQISINNAGLVSGGI